MKRLLFTFNQEVLLFDINNKEIIYRDRKWPNGLRFIPKDPELVKMVIMSRNRIGNQLITWINDANSGKNLAEWEECKDDDDVAEVVKKDAKMRGCVLRKEFTDEELNNPANFDKAMIDKIPVEHIEEVEE